MISSLSLRHRPRLVLPLRASARHGDPLSAPQPIAQTLLQTTFSIVLKDPLLTAMLQSHRAGRPG